MAATTTILEIARVVDLPFSDPIGQRNVVLQLYDRHGWLGALQNLPAHETGHARIFTIAMNRLGRTEWKECSDHIVQHFNEVYGVSLDRPSEGDWLMTQPSSVDPRNIFAQWMEHNAHMLNFNRFGISTKTEAIRDYGIDYRFGELKAEESYILCFSPTKDKFVGMLQHVRLNYNAHVNSP